MGAVAEYDIEEKNADFRVGGLANQLLTPLAKVYHRVGPSCGETVVPHVHQDVSPAPFMTFKWLDSGHLQIREDRRISQFTQQHQGLVAQRTSRVEAPNAPLPRSQECIDLLQAVPG